jgi:hypothetical protein
VTKIDHGVAMRIGANERLHFLDCLRVVEMVELNRVLLWIEVHDRVSANTGLENKIVVAGTTNCDRDGLVYAICGVPQSSRRAKSFSLKVASLMLACTTLRSSIAVAIALILPPILSILAMGM